MDRSHLMRCIDPIECTVDLVHKSVDLVQAFFLRKITLKTIQNLWGDTIFAEKSL
jgi:hypothetical protein